MIRCVRALTSKCSATEGHLRSRVTLACRGAYQTIKIALKKALSDGVRVNKVGSVVNSIQK